MSEEKSNLPAISKQVTELVLAGSLSHAEQAFADAAEQHGDLAVAEVLQNIPPHVTALHMAGFDGGKLSLATLLVPPKAWADSLAYIAATWNEDMIEDDPERIAESLFSHIHGVVFGTEGEERRRELLLEVVDDGPGIPGLADGATLPQNYEGFARAVEQMCGIIDQPALARLVKRRIDADAFSSAATRLVAVSEPVSRSRESAIDSIGGMVSSTRSRVFSESVFS